MHHLFRWPSSAAEEMACMWVRRGCIISLVLRPSELTAASMMTEGMAVIIEEMTTCWALWMAIQQQG